MGLYLLYTSRRVMENITSFRGVPRDFLQAGSKFKKCWQPWLADEENFGL